MTDPTERFSNRVDTYVRARPSYPPEVLDLLAERCGLVPQTIVADVGSGTGILTRLLLGRGATVFAVEPNAAMRTAAEAALGSEPGFRSIARLSTTGGSARTTCRPSSGTHHSSERRFPTSRRSTCPASRPGSSLRPTPLRQGSPATPRCSPRSPRSSLSISRPARSI